MSILVVRTNRKGVQKTKADPTTTNITLSHLLQVNLVPYVFSQQVGVAVALSVTFFVNLSGCVRAPLGCYRSSVCKHANYSHCNLPGTVISRIKHVAAKPYPLESMGLKKNNAPKRPTVCRTAVASLACLSARNTTPSIAASDRPWHASWSGGDKQRKYLVVGGYVLIGQPVIKATFRGGARNV